MLNLYFLTALPVFLLIAWLYVLLVLPKNIGDNKNYSNNEKADHISRLISKGAWLYITAQNSFIFKITLACCFSLYVYLGPVQAIGFLISSLFVFLVDFNTVGLTTQYNLLVAYITNDNLKNTFKACLYLSMIIGYGIALLGLIFVSGTMLTLLFTEQTIYTLEILQNALILIVGISFTTLLGRLCGGIFTKGADTGADLVGKCDCKLPEDDSKNPASIADNIGDNVGDGAGSAKDIFFNIILANFLFINIISKEIYSGCMLNAIMFCGILAFIGPVISILVFLGQTNFSSIFQDTIDDMCGASNKNLLQSKIFYSLIFNIIVSTFLQIATLFSLSFYDDSLSKFLSNNVLVCILISGITVLISLYIISTQMFSNYRPLNNIARLSKNGAGFVFIEGSCMSYSTTALLVIISLASMFAVYYITGSIVGICILLLATMSHAPIIMSFDIFGSIIDNTGCIVEMSGMPSSCRETTDILDAIGNTTKAITKVFSLLCSTFISYISIYILISESKFHIFNMVNLIEPLNSLSTWSGIVTGFILVFWIMSYVMRAVQTVATAVINNVINQMEEDNNAILKGHKEPNYHSVITSLTDNSKKYIILPVVFPIILILAIIFIGQNLPCYTNYMSVLAGFVFGASMLSIFMAYYCIIAGAIWDNNKKLIEADPELGGKHSQAHIAGVNADIVGDSFKDTIGPFLLILSKSLPWIALLFLLICKI